MELLRDPYAATRDSRPAAAFSVELSHDGARTRVRLIGELDMATAPDAASGLLIATVLDDQPVEVDLAGLQFMDARGLHVLLTAHARLGDRLTLRPGPRCVQRLFELTGTAAALPFDPPAPSRPRRAPIRRRGGAAA
jgi:anti-anti-sigma factor